MGETGAGEDGIGAERFLRLGGLEMEGLLHAWFWDAVDAVVEGAGA